VPAQRIHVIPYGTDAERFHPPVRRAPSNRLRLLFVGTINQRKGIKYLLAGCGKISSFA
jgi:glycosyltransferase involved in cell wall biosynthesis